MIIVIQPGSANLRIGRSGDPQPVIIPHAVAIKRKPGGRAYRDQYLPGPDENLATNPAVIQELEESRLRISHVLQSCVQSNGNRRYATPPQQIAAYNRRSVAAPSDFPPSDWLATDRDTVLGEDIFRLNPEAPYNLHYPIRRGLLNIHDGVGGSLWNVLDHLHTIWEYAITEKLGIPKKELANCKAVLVVPDIFNWTHLKELTSILLNRLGFDSCFLVQDHVAAMFGTGVGSACVVDVGAEKTSISCVDEGASQPRTRVCLEYGGSDITRLFLWLLQKCAFPHKDCKLEDPVDFQLLNSLKENCHLNLDVCGAQEHTFQLARPGCQLLDYTILFGDELMIAPMALFHTELMSLSGPAKSARTQAATKSVQDPEDCFGWQFIRETGILVGKPPPPNPNPKKRGPRDQADNENNENGDDDMAEEEDEFFSGAQITGIDQAILQSIERCPTEEMRKKMYSSIILVGGGCKFSGAEKWLQMRLSNAIPEANRRDISLFVNQNSTKDPATVAWKGAAIMSGLESATELFISQGDWHKMGIKVLRERSPFAW